MSEMSGSFIIAILISVLCGIKVYKSFDDAANKLNRFIKFFTVIEMIISFFMTMYFTKFLWFTNYFGKNDINDQNFFVCLVLAIFVSMNIYIASLFVIGLCNMMSDIKKIKEKIE